MIGPSRRSLLGAAALLALSFGTGCKKDKSEPEPDPGDQGPPPITDAQKKVGVDACQDYQMNVCAAAEADDAYKFDCETSGARIDSLELAVKITRNPKMSAKDRGAALNSVKKTIAACVEDLAKLKTKRKPE